MSMLQVPAATKYSPYPYVSPRVDLSCSSYSEPIITEIRVRRPPSSYSLPGTSGYSSTTPPVLHIPESTETTPTSLSNKYQNQIQLPYYLFKLLNCKRRSLAHTALYQCSNIKNF